MPNPIDSVTLTGTTYASSATIQDVYNSGGGSFVVKNAAVYYRLQWGAQGLAAWTPEVPLEPGGGAIPPGVTGIQFRNALASSQATVSAYIVQKLQPALTLGFSTSTAVTSTYKTNSLAADVPITVGGTFVDGPSLSLTAGTWLLDGNVTVIQTANGANSFVAKLWDGVTAIDSCEQWVTGNNQPAHLSLGGILTINATTTYKISVTNTAGVTAAIKAATVASPSGNNASTLVAVQIA